MKVKFKPGDKVLFDFAGSRKLGVFKEHKKVTYGSTIREYYVCTDETGTIYPVDKTQVYKDDYRKDV